MGLQPPGDIHKERGDSARGGARGGKRKGADRLKQFVLGLQEANNKREKGQTKGKRVRCEVKSRLILGACARDCCRADSSVAVSRGSDGSTHGAHLFTSDPIGRPAPPPRPWWPEVASPAPVLTSEGLGVAPRSGQHHLGLDREREHAPAFVSDPRLPHHRSFAAMQGCGLRTHCPGSTRSEEVGLGLDGGGTGARRQVQHRGRRPHSVGEGHQGAAEEVQRP